MYFSIQYLKPPLLTVACYVENSDLVISCAETAKRMKTRSIRAQSHSTIGCELVLLVERPKVL